MSSDKSQQQPCRTDCAIEGSHLTLIVIGKVTHDTARILVEMLEGGPTTVTLTRVQQNARSILPPSQPSALRTPIADDDEAEVKQQREAEHKSDKPDGKKNNNNNSSSKDGVEMERVAGARVDEAGGPSVSVTEDLQPARPRIFKFTGLEENARYAVTIAGLAHSQPQSSFVTLIKDWKAAANYPPMRVASVSCNLLSETRALKAEQVDLWADLADRIQRGEIDYLMHIGDQVYADEPRSMDDQAPPVSAFAPSVHAAEGEGQVALREKDQLVFKRCLALLEKHGATTPAQYKELHPRIEELYRQLYRETWSHPPTQRALANVPNLTIYDDHDFVDNWGTHDSHHDPESAEFAIGWCARQVYYEYQASLHRDVELERVPEIEDDHHFHVFGEFGFVFTESRGATSFRYRGDAEPYPFLGSRQWADIEAALAPDGLFKNVRHLLIVCPCPVVYLPHGLNAAVEPMVEDAQGHWASARFIQEQTKMLNLALEWQEGKGAANRLKDLTPPTPVDEARDPVDERKGVTRTSYPSLSGTPVRNSESGVLEASPLQSTRRCTFVGGDVHVGGHTQLFKHGHLVMEQLVSSAIANHILPSLAFAIGQMVQNAYTQLEDGWSFHHQPYTRFRNYGLIDTQSLPGDKKPQVVTHIIAAE